MGEVTAAIYARVSTEQQTRGNTVASQLALLRDRAETDKVRLEPDHTFVDEGYSGSTLIGRSGPQQRTICFFRSRA
jgi:site-specific DNA recombinase